MRVNLLDVDGRPLTAAKLRPSEAKFQAGMLNVTPGVASLVHPIELRDALERHLQGDWGDMCEGDKKANDAALQVGGRLMSAYHTKRDPEPVKFWVITEANRVATTFLLPEEY